MLQPPLRRSLRLALESGKAFCMPSTDLSNPTSNSIYQKMGYRVIADVMDVKVSNQGEEA